MSEEQFNFGEESAISKDTCEDSSQCYSEILLSLGQFENIKIVLHGTPKELIDQALELQAYKNSKDTYIDDRKSESKDAPKNETKKSRETLPWFKIEYDKEYTVKVISDDGEYRAGKYDTHGFTIESEGNQYKLSTTSKVLIESFIVGSTVRFKKYKDGTYTKYELLEEDIAL